VATGKTASEPKTEERTFAKWTEGYDNPGRVRVISKADVRALGAEIDQDLVWDVANKHSLDVTDLPAEVLTYLKDTDPDFRVTTKTVEVPEV
jgi:hypothetical protein